MLHRMSARPPQEPGPPGDHTEPAASPPPPPTGPRAERVLRRSSDDRLVAGVCGGLGRYLGVDPVLLRIAAVVLALANGLGVVAYVIAWIVIPEERSGQPAAHARPPRQEMGRLVLGGSLVVLGLVLLLDRLAPDLQRLFWPLAVVAAGAAIMLVGLRR
jgi:phage shock protein C